MCTIIAYSHVLATREAFGATVGLQTHREPIPKAEICANRLIVFSAKRPIRKRLKKFAAALLSASTK